MQRLSTVLASFVVVGAVMGLLLTPCAAGQALQLNLTAEGHTIHILPTVDKVKAVAALNNGGTPPLLYNGGPVMLSPTVYAIYWIPPHLQDGSATSMTKGYQNVQTTLFKEYFGHAIANNNTQYYQVVGPKTSYILNKGSLGGTYVDTSLYPAGGCSDAGVPTATNCITDADLQIEISKVMGIKGWTGGLNKMFLLFTSLNEGQCTDSSNTQCSYVQYCAYHSYFVNGAAQDVVYGNEPYGNTTACQIPGAPSPNGNPEADAAATAASHELTEAITDPLLNAWFDSSGSEIGDECAYFYGYAGWDGGLANEKWDGHFFFIQTELSNYLFSGGWSTDASFPGCFNSGPEL